MLSPHDQPVLLTSRLMLRPFTLADLSDLVVLAGDREVAAMTLSIPHPYTAEHGREWISQQPQRRAEGKAVNFAIALPNHTLCGSIGLGLNSAQNLAELGYWVGQPYRGQGYATEAARAVIDFGFGTLGLNRINATHFSDNPASGRVMEKLGLVYEGGRRRHTLKWGEYRDIKLYGLLREDWSGIVRTPPVD
ncbi:MAG: GNAT family N-acetyltransferase [Nodosilinea sp.]